MGFDPSSTSDKSRTLGGGPASQVETLGIREASPATVKTKWTAPTKGSTQRVGVTPKIKVTWDAAELAGEVNSPTGSGKMEPHYKVCTLDTTSSFAQLCTKKIFNSVCNAPLPLKTQRKYKVKFYKDLGAGIVPQRPLVSMRYEPSRKQWRIHTVTAFAVVRWHEPVAGFNPVCGENVTIDKRYGVRGLKEKPAYTDRNAKGYYVDVAKNLRLYKSATNKNTTDIYWWVKGSTKRHEWAHLKYYRRGLDKRINALLRKTSQELNQKIKRSRILITKEELEDQAGRILMRLITLAEEDGFDDNNEDYVSEQTAKEFHREAEKILKWGKAEEKKVKK
jgi:hypothetical protein